MSNLNLPLFELLKARLRAAPDRYNQSTFGEIIEDMGVDYPKPSDINLCNTQCCMAGEVFIIVKGPEKFLEYVCDPYRSTYDIQSVAQDALGISRPTAQCLFGHTDTWPLYLQVAYNQASTQAEIVEVACTFLDAVVRFDDDMPTINEYFNDLMPQVKSEPEPVSIYPTRDIWPDEDIPF